MRKPLQIVYVAGFFFLQLSNASHAQNVNGQGSKPLELDAVTGLIQGQDWEVVRTSCTSCHTAQLITQNSGSREVWLSRIEWMQETQGLQQLAPDVQEKVLQYLAEYYGPKPATRRPALASHLLPANPYNP